MLERVVAGVIVVGVLVWAAAAFHHVEAPAPEASGDLAPPGDPTGPAAKPPPAKSFTLAPMPANLGDEGHGWEKETKEKEGKEKKGEKKAHGGKRRE